MRDRSKELNMLNETLQILKQGFYEKNGKRVNLKLSHDEMREIQVYLPDDVYRRAEDPGAQYGKKINLAISPIS